MGHPRGRGTITLQPRRSAQGVLSRIQRPFGRSGFRSSDEDGQGTHLRALALSFGGAWQGGLARTMEERVV
jgi:hypothetical protein